MKDSSKKADEILDKVLASSSLYLEGSRKDLENLGSILHWAKTPKERTAIKIIIDDERKVVKALERLVNDLADL